MTKIYIVDNGGQWTHREWRTLRDIGVDTKIVPNTTPLKDLISEDIDGLVLSGGAPRIGLNSELGNCAEYLEKAEFPILGICAGHQFMARFFGGDAKPSKIPEFGKIGLTLLVENEPLFEKVPKKSIVWESHNDEVTVLPKMFELLAESENCKIQAMRHKKKPFYGLQFHPEVEHTEYGEQIFKNFVKICE
ncbi:MAG: GMP synthase subunit A [Candidatus Thermoplasmatota archaeon]|jgi:GMP synthase (glutamine-hydrolysing)|nr:GMP synthase subunit A [Candidatus Thermoplasmatota archaeon]